jgi:hypothetical protein
MHRDTPNQQDCWAPSSTAIDAANGRASGRLGNCWLMRAGLRRGSAFWMWPQEREV